MNSSVVPIHVGVVFGGASGEHAVSIRSATTVISALRRGANAERYRISCFYIDPTGTWWPSSVAESVLSSGQPLSPAQAEPSTVAAGQGRPGFRGLPTGATDVQVWFPVLHGPNGEDGTIQGLFTLMGVPFVGSGVLGSAMGMDKQAMKAAFAAAGLPQVPYVCLDAEEFSGSEGMESLLTRLESRLGYPCFVKPANMGSSVGITRATDRSGLLSGLRTAAALDPRLVVERGVVARELECAVLGTTRLRASVVGEIRFDADWYDYETKYADGLSHTVIPAQVPDAISAEVRRMAIEACRALAVTGLARVDFFYCENPAEAVAGIQESGTLWLNEVNTMPGFTTKSMYPMLWDCSGIDLDDLVHALVTDAVDAALPTSSGERE